jgi:hypothetical protein
LICCRIDMLSMGVGCVARTEKNFKLRRTHDFSKKRHPLFMVWLHGQSISFIKSSWFVNDCKVKLGEEEEPACLLLEEFLLCVKICKVIVVGSNFENLGVSF